MKKIIVLILMSLAVYSHTSNAALIGIDNVYGENSLYHDDWGHSYIDPLASDLSNNEAAALGRGFPAEAWQNASGNAYGFTSGDNLLITATGCVVDNGSACTGPDGGGNFRGLPVYALIGIWSNDADAIDPINSPFLVGALLSLIVPDNGLSSPLYLFLATNDGIFSDNYYHNGNPVDLFYDTYSVEISSIPLPATFWLMASGLLFVKRLRKQ